MHQNLHFEEIVLQYLLGVNTNYYLRDMIPSYSIIEEWIGFVNMKNAYSLDNKYPLSQAKTKA